MTRNETFLQLLRRLSFDKIDFATAHLLSHWDSFSGGDEVSRHHLHGAALFAVDLDRKGDGAECKLAKLKLTSTEQFSSLVGICWSTHS